MEFIFFLGGVIVGISFGIPIGKPKKVQGIIDVDHDTNMCRVTIDHNELDRRNLTKAIVYINHHATISREEQTL